MSNEVKRYMATLTFPAPDMKVFPADAKAYTIEQRQVVLASDYDALRTQLEAIRAAGGEEVEVVAWMWRDLNGDVQFNYMHPEGQELMTVAQHQRIVAAMAAELEKARRTAEYWKQEHLAGNAVIEQLRTALDLGRQAIERADFTTGVCSCGGYLHMHSACDNHAPVDSGTAYKLMVVKAIDDAFLFQSTEVKP